MCQTISRVAAQCTAKGAYHCSPKPQNFINLLSPPSCITTSLQKASQVLLAWLVWWPNRVGSSDVHPPLFWCHVIRLACLYLLLYFLLCDRLAFCASCSVAVCPCRIFLGPPECHGDPQWPCQCPSQECLWVLARCL